MNFTMTNTLPDDDFIAEWERSIRFLDDKHPQVVYFRQYIARLQVLREAQQREATEKRIQAELKALKKSMPRDASKRQISDAM